MQPEAIKSCPFCGGRAVSCYIRDGRQVICTCGARGPTQFHGLKGPDATDRLAIEAWNRRAPLSDEQDNESFKGDITCPR